MATITKRLNARGEPKYRASIRRAGFPQRCKTFSSKKAADAWARAIEADFESLSAGTAPANVIPLADIAREYLHGRPQCRLTGSPAVPGFRGKDRAVPGRIAVWVEELGALAVGRITPDHIRRVLAKLEARGTSGATRNRYLSVLSSVMRHGERYHGLPSNPCRRVAQAPEGKPRDRVLNDDEIRRLLAAAKCSEWPRLHAFVQLAMTTGARRGELVKLRWSDVDWRERSIVFRDTKNGSDRAVPLTDAVMEELQRFAEIGDGLVFASAVKPGASIDVYRHFVDALRWAGLAGTGVVLHTLRHTAVTRLAEVIDNPLRVAEFVGHRSLQTTKRYYHPRVEAQRELSAVLDVAQEN